MRIAGLRSLFLGATCTCAAILSAADAPVLWTPLVWKPTTTLTGIVNLVPFSGIRIDFLPLVDSRKDKALLGENLEKATPRLVRTSDEVEPFVTAKLINLLQDAGLPVALKAEGATIVVSGELLRFGVTERDTYLGEFRALIEVRSGGQLVWKGMAIGSASRFGRSFKSENYHEALSDSLVVAVSRLLSDRAFLSALSGKAPATAVPTAN